MAQHAMTGADPVSALAGRNTRAVIEDHLRLRVSGRLEEDLARNYAPDVVLLTSNSCMAGHQALRVSAERLARELPDAQFECPVLQVSGEYALLIWQATSARDTVHCGADSFVVRDGLIRVQTVHYCLLGPDGRTGVNKGRTESASGPGAPRNISQSGEFAAHPNYEVQSS